MKLSIIIPVYNVEATLHRCVSSVVEQTFRDMEIILVDDGSPDNCPQLCDEWALRDERINVVHKANGGLSDARNAGISVAQGEYITFVDSDDYLHTDTYQQVMPIADTCDIVEFSLSWHHGAPDQRLISLADCCYTDMKDYWLRAQTYEHTYAWNKIYRRQLFEQVRFPYGRIFEDVATLPLLLQQAHCVRTTSKGRYYYCFNHDGITAMARGKGLSMLLESHLKVMETWCDDLYYMHVLNIQIDVYRFTNQDLLLPYRTVFPLSGQLTGKLKLKAMALRLLGMKRLCKLIKANDKIWKRHL